MKSYVNKVISVCLSLVLFITMWLPMRHINIKSQAAYYSDSELSGIRNTVISNNAASKYVNAAMRYYLKNVERVKNNLTNNTAVVFFFDGCSDNVFSSSFNYTSNHKSAYVAVVKLVSEKPTIVYENENSSTIPDNPRYVANNTAGNSGTDVPTVIDGIHNISTYNHMGYAALHLGDSNPSAVDVIRCNSSTYYSSTSTGIDIHARSWDYVSLSTYSSTGCFNVGPASSMTEYNNFMKAVTGINDAKTNTFSNTMVDAGIAIVDRYMYKSTLTSIYNSSAIVNKLTAYSTEIAPLLEIEDDSHSRDTSYGTNFPAYPKRKIESNEIFDEHHNACYSGAWIGTDELCTIVEVYTDGCCKVTYPLSSGALTTRYSKIALFNTTPDRATRITRWLSESGNINGTSVSSGTTQTRYYYWYKLYDANTGDLLDTYNSSSYTVSMNIYYSDGTPVFSPTVEYNNDNNWISFVPQKADTYKCEVILSGGWTGSYTDYFTVGYDASFPASSSNVSLNLNGTNSTAVRFTKSGGYPGVCGATWSTADSSIVSTSGGGWSNGVFTLNLQGLKRGSTDVTVKLYENYTDNQTIVATSVIHITVTCNSYTVSYNANGGTGAPSDQIKYYGTDLTLSSTKPIRSGYTFLGWATSSTATSSTYTAGGNYTSNSSVTLYAVWKLDNVFWGDINLDGTVNASDVTLLDAYISNATTLTEEQLCRADVNFDMLINVQDHNSLVLYIANLKSGVSAPTFGIETTTSMVINECSKKTYVYGEEFDLSSIEVVVFSNKTFEYYSFYLSKAIISGYSATSIGKQNVKITIGPFSLTQEITVVEKNYSITFNANGGTGAPNAQTKYHGLDLTLSSTKPTRTGYTFLGWSTSSTATSATYTAGGNYTSNSSATLYAVWKRIEYTVSYNANGGTGAPSSQTKYYGTDLTLSSTKPTRSGYTFLGWATSSTATSSTYTAGGTYTTDTSTTLYAVWKKDTTLTVNSSYTANITATEQKIYYSFTPTTSGKYVIYSTGVYENDAYVTLYNSSGATLETNDDGAGDHQFLLAYSLTAGTTYRYEVKLCSSSKTGNIPFTFGNVYTITYNANNGSGAPSAQDKYYGKTLTLSSTKPTRTGYTFLGWSTSSTATSATYTAGGNYTSNSSTTLYAVWKSNEYTVSYNANGGTGVPSSQIKYHGTDLTLSSTKPTRTGYTFLGWSTSSTATSATYTAGGNYTSNSSVTLYAVWKPIEYTITLYANGGTFSGGTVIIKYYGIDLTLPTVIPTRAGYTFLGWATSSTATNATYAVGGKYTSNASVNLYAVWKADPITYTVAFNGNGGTVSPASSSITAGGSITLPTPSTRSGYICLGWATSSTATSAAYTCGSSYTPTSNITLYAIWKVEPSILVGDVNYDGEIDAADAGLISRYDAGFITLTAEQLLAGDVNKDGEVDAADAGLISRYDAGFISSFDDLT